MALLGNYNHRFNSVPKPSDVPSPVSLKVNKPNPCPLTPESSGLIVPPADPAPVKEDVDAFLRVQLRDERGYTFWHEFTPEQLQMLIALGISEKKSLEQVALEVISDIHD